MFILVRQIFILLILLLYPVLLFAAGASEPEPERLVVWDFKYNDPRTKRVFNRVDKLFRDAYPDVQLVHIGFDEENYVPALRAALLANTAPDIIFLHHGTEFTEFQSYLLSLDGFLDKGTVDFREKALDRGRSSSGIQKALPLTMQGMGWYYNRQLFAEAGLDPDNPPRDWESFLDACARLKEHGIIPIAMGNNRPLTTDFIRRSLITAFLTDQEIEHFYRRGQGIASQEFRLIMDFCLTLVEQGYLDPSGTFRPYFNYASDTFKEGRAAMTIGLLSDIANWHEYSPALGRGRVGYFPNLIHPRMKRPEIQLLQDAGVLVGVNSRTAVPGHALNYLETLFSPPAQRLLTEELGMLIPVRNAPLPVEDYPVLAEILDSLKDTGYDLELFTGSLFIRDFMYRYDSLLLNTREISIDDYITILFSKLQLF